MKLNSRYTFTNNRQIWRIIPGGEGKLVIEERDPATKEVFFNCIEMNTGKVILDSLQLEEKFWIGIEDIYKDIIFFHRYNKPDMPWHSGIIAYDLKNKEQLWHLEEYIFLLTYDDKLYCYKNKYEGRIYFSLNYKTGELIADLGDNADVITGLKVFREKEIYKGYKFPDVLNYSNREIVEIFDEVRSNEVITGKVDYLIVNDLLLTSYHKVLNNNKLQNCFKALDIHSKKIIFEETLNKEISNFIPDSFFIINDLIFLLKEKDKLFVAIIND